MDQAQIVEGAKQILSNPIVQVGVALVILKVIPNNVLVKIPIIGSTVQAFLNSWANKKLNDFDFQRDVMEKEADRTVRAKEQDIKNGKIDQTVAKAQATQELMSAFKIDKHEANKLVEASVNKLPKIGELIAIDGNTLEEQR